MNAQLCQYTMSDWNYQKHLTQEFKLTSLYAMCQTKKALQFTKSRPSSKTTIFVTYSAPKSHDCTPPWDPPKSPQNVPKPSRGAPEIPQTCPRALQDPQDVLGACPSTPIVQTECPWTID